MGWILRVFINACIMGTYSCCDITKFEPLIINHYSTNPLIFTADLASRALELNCT